MRLECSMLESADSFQTFAGVCDACRATASKLEKSHILATYLRNVPRESLGIAVSFLAAQGFAPSSNRALGVGGALVVESVRTVLNIDRTTLNHAFRAAGEIGEGISELWSLPGTDTLTLPIIQAAFDRIEAVGAQDAKRAVVIDLLRACSNREAVYLLKIILGDMRIGVSEGMVETAIAEAFESPLVEVRAARLLVGDLDAVAALAFERRLGEARFRPFNPLGYMLAQPIMTAAEAIEVLAKREAIAEDKYDGIRAQLHVSAGRVELFSRGSSTVTGSFSDIVGPLAKSEAAFVLDGEIVPMRIAADGAQITLPFSSLQKRLGRKTLTPRMLREAPCVYVAFDCLFDGADLLIDRPLRVRRERLAAIAAQHRSIVLGPHVPITNAEALDAAFVAARNRRNEGLVIKQLDSLYTPGRRGDAWLKLKSHLPTLDVVVIGAERGHGKRRDVLSDVTFAVRRDDSDELVTLGKAYSGLTDVEIAALTERFTKETLEERGRYRIVRPSVVLEIAFDQITRSERHNSGYALRFPRIVRIREDKKPGDIDTLARVEQIYKSPDNLAVALDDAPPPEDVNQLSLFS